MVRQFGASYRPDQRIIEEKALVTGPSRGATPISFRADISLAVLLIVIIVAATRRRVVRDLLAGLVAGLIPTIVNVVQVGIVQCSKMRS